MRHKMTKFGYACDGRNYFVAGAPCTKAKTRSNIQLECCFLCKASPRVANIV